MYGIHVLLIEDDARLREIVQKYLEHENFTVFLAETGEMAFEQLEMRPYHMILLDVMLPDTDGWRILRHIRKQMDVPVIMLTARSEEDDKLFGFELGADDYVTKPFSTKLLLARMKAVLNRNKAALLKSEIIVNQIRIQMDLHQVFINEEKIDLTPIEYSLLLYFVDHINIALSRTQILNTVWGYDYYGDERTVDTHVKRLRQKLGSESGCVETVRGHGYRMVKGS
ncbi:MAG: response regulator transcription factor [Vallitaleaceae bacterium]|jgi:DNA-binding response OmpR family regulator|nr:response regulator transcription factor [Vallitaleaceae bacterium]